MDALPNGFYRIELNRTTWEVPERYQQLSPVGIGAYGQVVSALDVETQTSVAIKKLARPFQSQVHAKRTYRELKLLKVMDHENCSHQYHHFDSWEREWTFGAGKTAFIDSWEQNWKALANIVWDVFLQDPSPITHPVQYSSLRECMVFLLVFEVIGLLDVFTPNSSLDDFRDLYLVTALMGADLNNIIKFQSLSDDHVQFLIYQILRGLKYVHSAGVIHRDLKPSNIAVNEDCELKILDFGLARATDDEMTGYVATRWYRAPEIMLNWMHYSQNVDIWSVGCIMAELLTGKTLFPGSDHIDQLYKILQLVGTPDAVFMKKITSDSARSYLQSLPSTPKRPFSEIFVGANPLAIDILERMLVLDTDQRISAIDALAHPYFAKYSDPTDEPTCDPYDDSFEKLDVTIPEWKELVYKEVVDCIEKKMAGKVSGALQAGAVAMDM